MSTKLKRWFIGACLLLVLAVSYTPADAQVVVRVGPRHHHRRYYRHHRHYRHYRR